MANREVTLSMLLKQKFMIQYGLDIPHYVAGFFTLENHLVNLNLSEIEDKLGYQKGRLKQGADIYIVTPPTRATDFKRMGTSVFPGHKFDQSNLHKAIDTTSKREKDLNTFRRKRIIKIMPLQIHMEAMRQYLTDEQFFLIKDMNILGRSEEEIIKSIEIRYRNNRLLIAQIKNNFKRIEDVYEQKPDMNDKMYPMATGGGVPQWELLRKMPARCVCRMTDYTSDRYQRLF